MNGKPADTKICELCSGISPQALVPKIGPPTKDSRAYRHLEKYKDLAGSAQNCALCKLILHQFLAAPQQNGRYQHRPISILDGTGVIQHEARNITIIEAAVSRSSIRAQFSAFATPGSAAARSGDVSGRAIPDDGASDQSFSLIKSWMQECDRGHPKCKLKSPNQLHMNEYHPSRLLDLGLPALEPDYCTLVSGSQCVGPYAALSYCWGTSQTLQTRKSNVTDHARCIQLQMMPLTLRQAVSVVRRLGLRYLWIDALCIVQDDPQEWEQEAPKMGDIYRHASFTVCATGSTSSAGGLFLPREGLPAPPIKLPYPHSLGDSASEEDDHFFLTPRVYSMMNCVEKSAWNTRGWVFQERIFSRRMIHFSKGQTFFECKQHSRGEDGHNFPSWVYDIDNPSENEAWKWCHLIEQYSTRNLTVLQDKLFAVQGLAGHMAARTQKAYCMGLWVEDLGFQVLWYANNNQTAKPSKPVAPSWSWASLQCQILWESWILEAKPCSKLSVSSKYHGLRSISANLQFAPLVVNGPVISLQRSRDPFGNTSDAELTTSNPYQIDVKTHPRAYILCTDLSSANGSERIGWCVYDEKPENHDSCTGVVISENIIDEEDDEKSYNVLILCQSSLDPSKYQRLGIGEIVKIDCMKNAREDTLTIL